MFQWEPLGSKHVFTKLLCINIVYSREKTAQQILTQIAPNIPTIGQQLHSYHALRIQHTMFRVVSVQGVRRTLSERERGRGPSQCVAIYPFCFFLTTINKTIKTHTLPFLPKEVSRKVCASFRFRFVQREATIIYDASTETDMFVDV